MTLMTIALEVFLWGLVFIVLGVFGILALSTWYGRG